jgi:hypothetical protein
MSNSAAHTSSGMARSAFSSQRVGRTGRATVGMVQTAGGQRQGQPGHSGQQRAQHRHGQRFPRAHRHFLKEHGRQVGWKKLAQKPPHAAGRFQRQKLRPLQIERPETGHHQHQQACRKPAGLAARIEQARRQQVGLVGGAGDVPGGWGGHVFLGVESEG